MAIWLPLLTALAGIIATILTYKLNPINQAKAQWSAINKQIKMMEDKRDAALVKNDNDIVTFSSLELGRLHLLKAGILREFPNANGWQ